MPRPRPRRPARRRAGCVTRRAGSRRYPRCTRRVRETRPAPPTRGPCATRRRGGKIGRQEGPMRPSVVATLALASSLLVPRLAGALTLEDCELWLQQLQGEVSQVQVGGAQGASKYEALLSDLKQASLRRKGTTPADSAKDVSHFKERAAQGNVSRLEGDRLNNLSDTVLHCIKHVQQPQ